MPDPLDTLRNDIAAMLYSWGGRVLSWEGVCKHDWDERDQFFTYADDVITVLKAASDEQRRALFELLGYEVREGWLDDTEPRTDGGVRAFYCTPFPCGDPPKDVLVLRDQRETTPVLDHRGGPRENN